MTFLPAIGQPADYSAAPPRIHIPKNSCKDHFSVLEPQINAQGVHKWPFDEFCPVDVAFFTGR